MCFRTKRLHLLNRVATLVVLFATGSCVEMKASASDACGAKPFSFTEDRIVLPITVVNDFIFVPAEIDGTRGKMMFDTGTVDALVLNDHLLRELGPAREQGHGQFGSGQSYVKRIRECVHGVSVGGSAAADIPDLRSNDLGFIEKDITPDFLGFIGFQAYPGYDFEIDYVRRRLVLQRSVKGRRSRLLDGERVLATLPFTTRRRPNDPLISMSFGGRPIIGEFDTGQAGGVEMSEERLSEMVRSRALIPLPEPDDDGKILYRVKGLTLKGGFHVDLPAMDVFAPMSIADKGIGVTEPAAIYLGYQFLAQFKTVWDWQNHTIFLLER